MGFGVRRWHIDAVEFTPVVQRQLDNHPVCRMHDPNAIFHTNNPVGALVGQGVRFEDIDVLWVPGAWEIPVAVRRALATERYDAAVAVGAVVRGDTPHFDIVAGETSRGLMDAMRDFDVPVTMGVLTTNTMEQAEARAGGVHGNKGAEAAMAALEMLDLFDQVMPPDEFEGEVE